MIVFAPVSLTLACRFLDTYASPLRLGWSIRRQCKSLQKLSSLNSYLPANRPTLMYVPYQPTTMTIHWLQTSLVCILVNRLTLDLRAFATQESLLTLSTTPAEFASRENYSFKQISLRFSGPNVTVVTSTFAEGEFGEQGRVTESRCGTISEQVEMQYLSFGRRSNKRGSNKSEWYHDV